MSNIISINDYLNEKALQRQAWIESIDNLQKTSNFYDDLELKAELLAFKHFGYDHEFYADMRFLEQDKDNIRVEIETPSMLVYVNYRNIDGIAVAIGGIFIEENRNILKFKM